MAIHEVSFLSHNQRDTIKGWIYTPITKPRGIVQVVHGLGEHSRRYLHMILKMNEAGFIVCADDHVGHGKTAADSDTWGDFGEKGFMTTTEDERSLRNIMVERYPGLPYILFGHSWGSMIARNYAAHYGEDLTALVICGTCGVFTALGPLEPELRKLVEEGLGAQDRPEYMGKMFAGVNDRYEKPLTPNDWVSGDPNVVADHAADPFNNLQNAPNVRSMHDLTCLVEAITGPDWAGKVPKSLPVYNIAGDCDPIGNYGEGVYAVSNWLWSTGHVKVTTKIYSGHRHEILNDRDIRNEVEDGIIEFIDSTL